VKTIQAYRFALDLTPAQERDVLAHAGAARVAHNWALARVKAVMDQRAAERTYGVPDEQLTASVSWSLPALRKAWNAAKPDVAPWWNECSKEAFNTGLDALARALRNWSDSRTGKRAGRPFGFPRFMAEFDTAGSSPVAGRGAIRKTRPGGQEAAKRQPGTAPAGQTGTVPPQGGTANRALARAH
jgi:putative transposase